MSPAVAAQPEQAQQSVVKDIRGMEITPDCEIVYATRNGSNTYQNVLRVKTVSPTKITGYRPSDVNRRTITLTSLGVIARVA